jgi:hypothetical protein
VLEHEDNGMMAQYQVTNDPGDTPPPGGGDPGTGGPTGDTSGPSSDPPPPAALPDLALRWLHPALSTRPGARLTLRLEASNKGSAGAPAASVAIGLPHGWKGRSALRVPALAPGAKRVLSLRVQVAKSRRAKAQIMARLRGAQPGNHADDHAALVYRLSHGRMRLAARAAAAGTVRRAAPQFICRLLAGT